MAEKGKGGPPKEPSKGQQAQTPRGDPPPPPEPPKVKEGAIMKVNDLSALIEKYGSRFALVAAEEFDVRRMVKLAQLALSRHPDLATCTVSSILVTLMACSEAGLEPGVPTGGMHLVPFKNKRTGKRECQGIIDYRAYLNIGYASGVVSAVRARVVYAKDEFKHYEDETGIHFRWTPAEGNRGDIRGAFAVVELKAPTEEGQKIQFDYMPKAEIDAIFNRSPAGKGGPWGSDYGEMAKKTVVRRVFKLVAQAKRAQRAAAYEEKVESGQPLDLAELGPASGPSTADEVEAKLAAGTPAGGDGPPPPASAGTDGGAASPASPGGTTTDELNEEYEKEKGRQREPGED